MIAADIKPTENQTAVEYRLAFGEREFTEAVEAIYPGVASKSWTTVVNGTTGAWVEPYRDVFRAPLSATNYRVRFIKFRPHANVVTLLDAGDLVTEFSAAETSELVIESPVVREFSQAGGGDRPMEGIIRMADLVVQACQEYTDGAHVSFDDEDGCLDFHLRLKNGHLVMADIFLSGDVDASVYDDSQGAPAKLVRRLRRGQTSGEDLIELFRYGG